MISASNLGELIDFAKKNQGQLNQGLLGALDALVEPTSRGDPMSPLRWTCKSTTRLAQETGWGMASVSAPYATCWRG